MGGNWGSGSAPELRGGPTPAPRTAWRLTVRNVSLKCENTYAAGFPIIFCPFIPSHLHWLLINVDLWCNLYNCSVCQSVKRTPGASRAGGATGSLRAEFQSLATAGRRLGPTWAPGEPVKGLGGFGPPHSEAKTGF